MNRFTDIFLISALLFFTQAQAQTKSDSLIQIWNNQSLVDTSRLKAIDQVGYEFLNRDPDSAIYYAKIEYDFAIKNGWAEYAADALYTLGDAYDLKGELAEAIKKYNQALELYREIGDKRKTSNVLYNIGQVHWTDGAYREAINAYNKSMAVAQEIGNKRQVSDCLQGIAYSYFQQGQYATAMKHVQKSLKICEEIEYDYGIAWCMNALGVFYSRQGNNEKQLEYYKKALVIREKMGDTASIAYSLRNIGLSYLDMGNEVKAMEYLKKTLALDRVGLTTKRSLAISLGAIGFVYKKQGMIDSALIYYQESLKLSREMGNRDMICEDLQDIGSLYMDIGNLDQAISYCQESYGISMEIESLVDQYNACDCLYEANKKLGRYEVALAFHEKTRVLDDSINDESLVENTRQMEFKNQMMADSIRVADEKQKVKMAYQLEVSEKEKSRNMFMAGGLILLLISLGLFGRNRYVRKAKVRIEKEKDRSENLLLNILPAEIAEELKEKGRADARDFDLVSILFTDFKGFTEQSEKLSAAELVNEINHCFEAFDGIMEKYGIEKIKTIGDAYMAAGGLPVPTDDSVKNTVLAALEMQEFIVQRHQYKVQRGEAAFEMRVGIHTGPVVAGIVGVKKFQYDIWGDTVNTASRMESSGEVGKVNISQATYELLKNAPQFSFESRGKIEAKGKGEMEMYFVKGMNSTSGDSMEQT